MTIWSAEIKEIESLYQSFKGHLPELERELEQLIRTDDSNVIMLYARRYLEVIITDLCESELKRPRKTEPLKGIIDRLSKEEKVPAHIITSMDSLNSLSTFGAHPKEYDPEQVRPVLINLSTISKWYLRYKNVFQATDKGLTEKTYDLAGNESETNEPGTILFYKGPVNADTITVLLSGLKKSKEFRNLNKILSKRVYSIVVECLENISKYSLKENDIKGTSVPFLSIRKSKNEILIRTGNPVSDDKLVTLEKNLKLINELDEITLKEFYDERINQELKPQDSGAGLGFILMALKSGNKIDYSFKRENDESYSFEIKIHVSEIIGKKLIIEGTLTSPAVVFDPDKNIYEISGESRPPDVPGFYGNLLKWLDEFNLHLNIAEPKPESVVFDFNFEYYNSLSAKYILEFLKRLAKINEETHIISIRWHYEEDDLDMFEAGREISRIIQMPVEYVVKEE